MTPAQEAAIRAAARADYEAARAAGRVPELTDAQRARLRVLLHGPAPEPETGADRKTA
jgi:hypothetical protein